VADRRWGWSVLATAALVPLSLPFAVSVPVLVGARDVLRRRSERRRRQDQHESALPEVLELVAVAIRAGGTVPAAMTLLEQRGPGVTAPAFRAVLARAAAGMPLTVALADLPGLLGEPYRPLTAALVSAEADGAPLVTVVNQLSLDAQQARRRLAESRARQVPVRLLLPLVCCTLPAVLVIAVVPLAIVGGGLPG
jgi:tight adherence protein C